MYPPQFDGTVDFRLYRRQQTCLREEFECIPSSPQRRIDEVPMVPKEANILTDTMQIAFNHHRTFRLRRLRLAIMLSAALSPRRRSSLLRASCSLLLRHLLRRLALALVPHPHFRSLLLLLLPPVPVAVACAVQVLQGLRPTPD